ASRRLTRLPRLPIRPPMPPARPSTPPVRLPMPPSTRLAPRSMPLPMPLPTLPARPPMRSRVRLRTPPRRPATPRRLLPTRSRSNSNELPLEEPLAHTGPGRRVTSPVRALSSADPGMSVTVRDARVLASDRRWIEGVYRDYLDDLAPLNTGIFPALGEIGHREPDQL